MRDFLPKPARTIIFGETSPVRGEWKIMWRQKERALKIRMGAMVDKLNAKAQTLEPLTEGDYVNIQNQYGNHPSRWDKTCVLLHVGEHDTYMAKFHESRRLTARD